MRKFGFCSMSLQKMSLADSAAGESLGGLERVVAAEEHLAH